jgi:hypothetical protein
VLLAQWNSPAPPRSDTELLESDARAPLEPRPAAA